MRQGFVSDEVDTYSRFGCASLSLMLLLARLSVDLLNTLYLISHNIFLTDLNTL